MFNWFRKRRRKKLLATSWPDSWSLHLNRNVRLSWNLTPQEMESLQARIKIFVAEKNWEGIEGQVINDEVTVTVAAQACMMLLGVDDFYFDNVKSILMYPQSFTRQQDDGTISHRAGEAWQGGPIILSWRDTLSGGRNEDDGRNLVVHEFAHALDGLDGEMGGSIAFSDKSTAEQWTEMISKEFIELQEAKERGLRTLLDHYGATNRAEFFAVASETFFEQPRQLASEKPDLFQLLKKYYKVDPTNWRKKQRKR